MHTIIRSLFLLWMLFPSTMAIALDWDTLGRSVVRVVVSDDHGMGSGTAFAVDDAHHYVTNYHVIDAALHGGELEVLESVDPVRKLPARVVWSSSAKDLAILEVPGLDRPALPLGEQVDVHRGDPVRSYGYPGASDHGAESLISPKLKAGVISARQRFTLGDDDDGPKTELFEHDATVNSGNSGGPLFDTCGRVIGVNQSKATTRLGDEAVQTHSLNIQEGTFFSIRVDELRRALDANGIHYRLDPEPCVPDVAVAPAGSVVDLPWGWLGLAAGLLLLLLTMAYRRLHGQLRQGLSDGARVDTRLLSRLIHERLGRWRPGHDGGRSARPQAGADPDRRTVVMGPSDRVDRSGRPAQRHTLVMKDGTNADARRDTEVMKRRLLPNSGDWPPIELTDRPVLVGRDPNKVDIVVLDAGVSRRHLRLSRRGAQVWVEDLGSANGSFIDGQRLAAAQAVPLPAGAQLRIGNGGVVYRWD